MTAESKPYIDPQELADLLVAATPRDWRRAPISGATLAAALRLVADQHPARPARDACQNRLATIG